MNHIHMQAERAKQRAEALKKVTIINAQHGGTETDTSRMGTYVQLRCKVSKERHDIHGLGDQAGGLPTEPESFHYESNRWGDHIVVHTNEGGIDHLHFDSKEEAQSFIAKQPNG